MINWKLAYLILICLPFSSRRIPDAESRADLSAGLFVL
nr:MAG TPA: hypothetical protein [Caudoviricetes sp.]DAP23839.1 MAG TPA: hypothetical protein [Caudoviricetes sp.]DAS98391.1 MAG TPA: hypothetical protein [Bacteriophage sp.]